MEVLGDCFAFRTRRSFLWRKLDRRFILVKGTLKKHIFSCCIVNIYGFNHVVEMRDMWLIISNLRSSFSYPLCMGGDFNEIRKIGYRQGCTRSETRMRDFNHFIDDMELYDLPMLGRKYT